MIGLERSKILVWIMVLVGIVIVGRLFYLQVLQYDYYSAEAAKVQRSKFTIPAKRGLIYAKDGSERVVPLVLNEPAYTVYADPRYVKDADKTTSVLRRIAGGNVVDGFDKRLRQNELQYTVLAKQINKQQADLLRKEKLPGIGLHQQERRVYPEGTLASQMLGYVNNDSQGQYGLEQALNQQLTGEDGQLKAVTDVNGIPISGNGEDVETPAKDGANLVLHLDRNIQAYAEQALKTGLDKVKAKHGSVVIMDPRTGGVLAMANYPTYDPAKYYEVKDFSLFQNKTVSEPYEVGSVMKALTMGVGLNTGAVNPGSTYNNTGSVQVDDTVVKNVLHVPGTKDMTQVLEFSLNTGVIHVLKLLGSSDKVNYKGRSVLFDYFANHYLFGKKTGIEQSGEAPGRIISPDEADGNNVRYANMTFGQGLDITMVQATAAFSAAINGGTYYRPQLVGGYMQADGKIQLRQSEVVKLDVLSPTASVQLRDMLREARKRNMGYMDKPGYVVGGKTGTSQIIDPKTGKYVDDNAIGTYLGYGGNQTPHYVIMVRVVDAKTSGYSGSVAAAPIFADISNWLLDYLKIQPMQ